MNAIVLKPLLNGFFLWNSSSFCTKILNENILKYNQIKLNLIDKYVIIFTCIKFALCLIHHFEKKLKMNYYSLLFYIFNTICVKKN
jgi:hypothetical protein